MNPELIVVVALLTYGSRMVATTLVPTMPPAVSLVLERMPPALFAGLAVVGLVPPEGGVAELPVLAAAGGALVASPLRSIPACLVAGLMAYGAASAIL